MVAAKDRIRVNCDLRHVTVVLCCDPKAFTHCNPLDGMAEGGSLLWESDEEGEQAWERLPALGPQADHRQKNPRLHPARLRHRQKGHRPRRPPAPHAGQRLPRRILRRQQPASRVRHHPGAVPRRRPQAVRQEVRQARRRRRPVQHGSHDAGLRPGQGDQDRRPHRCRPLQPPRPGAAAHPRARHRRRGCLRHRLPLHTPCPQARPRAPHRQRRRLRRRVPLHLRLQPARHAALRHGRHRRRHRRHGFQIRRPPRDPALHPRKLHPVHGVHLCLP